MDAKRQVALAGVLRAHRHGRQHHAAHAILVERPFGGIEGDGLREDAVGHIGQMQVVRLGGAPRQDGHVVFELSGYAVGRDGKVDFSVHDG